MVLKYSLNLVAEPDVAAVEAARARAAQLVSAVLVLLDCELEHPDWRTVRSLSVIRIDFGTAAAADASTAIFKTLVLNVMASPVSSVEEPIANGMAPSAEKEYVPLSNSWTAAALTVFMSVLFVFLMSLWI